MSVKKGKSNQIITPVGCMATWIQAKNEIENLTKEESPRGHKENEIHKPKRHFQSEIKK